MALHGDDEGHSETEEPTEHGPVTSVHVLNARVDHQQEGHAGGEELRGRLGGSNAWTQLSRPGDVHLVDTAL